MSSVSLSARGTWARDLSWVCERGHSVGFGKISAVKGGGVMGNKATVGAKHTEWRIRGTSTERTTEVIVSSGLSEGTIMLCSAGNEARMMIKFTPHQFLEFKSMVDHCAKRFEQLYGYDEIDEVWADRFTHCNAVKLVKSLMSEGMSLREAVISVRSGDDEPKGFEATVLSEWFMWQISQEEAA